MAVAPALTEGASAALSYARPMIDPPGKAGSQEAVVGHSLARTDGFAKVTGRALYVDDLRPEGCLYGATVRSHVAHGKLLGIDREPAVD